MQEVHNGKLAELWFSYIHIHTSVGDGGLMVEIGKSLISQLAPDNPREAFDLVGFPVNLIIVYKLSENVGEKTLF